MSVPGGLRHGIHDGEKTKKIGGVWFKRKSVEGVTRWDYTRLIDREVGWEDERYPTCRTIERWDGKISTWFVRTSCVGRYPFHRSPLPFTLFSTVKKETNHANARTWKPEKPATSPGISLLLGQPLIHSTILNLFDWRRIWKARMEGLVFYMEGDGRVGLVLVMHELKPVCEKKNR